MLSDQPDSKRKRRVSTAEPSPTTLVFDGNHSVSVPAAQTRHDAASQSKEILAQQLGVATWQVHAAQELLSEGTSLPFVARYRKEQTGGLDDTQLRHLQAVLQANEALADRKEAFRRALQSQGQLSQQLAAALAAADCLAAVEDLYLPFKPKRTTRASAALAKGLGSLAEELLSGPMQGGLHIAAARHMKQAKPTSSSASANTVEEALAGAADIIAEKASEVVSARMLARRLLRMQGCLTSTASRAVKQDKAAKQDAQGKAGACSGAAKTAAAAAKKKGAGMSSSALNPETYASYHKFTCPARFLKAHQVLALNRGEALGYLTLHMECAAATAQVQRLCLQNLLPSPCAAANCIQGQQLDVVTAGVSDGISRLLMPSAEREVRSELTAAASEVAAASFGRNLRSLLLTPPLQAGQVVMGVDPGFTHGCKIAVVGPTGTVLDTGVIFLHRSAPAEQAKARQSVQRLLQQHGVTAIALGDGVACTETEKFLMPIVQAHNASNPAAASTLGWAIVSESGASIWSASEAAAKELPQLDVTLRGAVSLARRLQDPLAELVKVSPSHLGVGMYQHDLKAAALAMQLDGVVEDAVCSVGVQLNAASAPLLARVAGLSAALGAKIVEHRTLHGPFTSRQDLLSVKGLGPRTFEQCAGFLRISTSSNALDNTSVHPESYTAAAAAVFMLMQSWMALRAASGKQSQPTAGRRKLKAVSQAPKTLAPPPQQLQQQSVQQQSARCSSHSDAIDLAGPDVVDLTGLDGEGSSPALLKEPRKRKRASVSAAVSAAATSEVESTQLPASSSAAAAAAAAVALLDSPICTASIPAGNSRCSAEQLLQVQALIPALLSDVGHMAAMSAALAMSAVGLQGVLEALAAPSRDPRGELQVSTLRSAVGDISSLKVGAQMLGRVQNVVDFGAFVDIRVGVSGLVHRSAMICSSADSIHPQVGQPSAGVHGEQHQQALEDNADKSVSKKHKKQQAEAHQPSQQPNKQHQQHPAMRSEAKQRPESASLLGPNGPNYHSLVQQSQASSTGTSSGATAAVLLAVGDAVMVQVVDVDVGRKRISLKLV